MKVKIGDTTYDSNNQPIMLILSDRDKENIRKMDPEAMKYAEFPKGYTKEEAEEWMKGPKKKEPPKEEKKVEEPVKKKSSWIK